MTLALHIARAVRRAALAAAAAAHGTRPAAAQYGVDPTTVHRAVEAVGVSVPPRAGRRGTVADLRRAAIHRRAVGALECPACGVVVGVECGCVERGRAYLAGLRRGQRKGTGKKRGRPRR